MARGMLAYVVRSDQLVGLPYNGMTSRRCFVTPPSKGQKKKPRSGRLTWKIEQFICRSRNFGVTDSHTTSSDTRVVNAPETALILERPVESPAPGCACFSLLTITLTMWKASSCSRKGVQTKDRGAGKGQRRKIPNTGQRVEEDNILSFVSGAILVIVMHGPAAGHGSSLPTSCLR